MYLNNNNVNLNKIWWTHNVERRCYTHTFYTKGNTCYVNYVSNNMYTLCVNCMCNTTPVKLYVRQNYNCI